MLIYANNHSVCLSYLMLLQPPVAACSVSNEGREPIGSMRDIDICTVIVTQALTGATT